MPGPTPLSPPQLTMSKFNMPSILLFVDSLTNKLQNLTIVKSLPTMPAISLPEIFHALSPVIPLQVKFGIFLAMFMLSYLSHRSYLQAKVLTLEKANAELYKAVATLETQHEHLKTTVMYNERLAADVADKTHFMLMNSTYLQKALYKKLDLEEKYRQGKKEGNTANRQQAVQEYMIAEKKVARRFTDAFADV